MLSNGSCDETFTAPSFRARCKTVDVVSEIRCVLRNTAGVVSAGDLAQFFASTTRQLDDNTGCLSASQTYTVALGGVDGTYVKTPAQSIALFAALSSRGVYPGTQHHWIDVFTKTGFVVDHSPALSNMTNFDTAMGLPAASGGQANLFYNYWQVRQNAWSVMKTKLQNYADAYFGKIPNYTHQKTIMWRKLATDTTGMVTRVGIMFYANQFLTLSSISSERSTIASVSVSMTTVGGSSSGTRTNVTATDVRVLSPYLYQLNDAVNRQAAFVWDPATFGTRFWDTPFRSVSVSPIAGNRKDTISYPATPEQGQFRRDYWSYLAG
jgi:hypothetical protein